MSVPPGIDIPTDAAPKWFVPALVVLVGVAVWYLMRNQKLAASAAPAGTVV